MGRAWTRMAVGATLWATSLSAVTPAVQIEPAALVAVARTLKRGPDPEFSPLQRQIAAWGRRLFHDPRLSKDGKTSCATCHQAARAFADGAPTPPGHPHVYRNTPSLADVHASAWLFWDGRADSLTAQVFGPLESPFEMGASQDAVVAVIERHYRQDYERLFGAWPGNQALPVPPAIDSKPQGVGELEVLRLAVDGLRRDQKAALMHDARREKTPEFRLFATRFLAGAAATAASQSSAAQTVSQVILNVAVAIAEYERGLVLSDSAFDRFVTRLGGKVADAPDAAFGAGFGEEEWRGLAVFAGEGGCLVCHSGPNLSDGQFHNVGLEAPAPPYDLGRAVGIVALLKDPFNCRGGILAPSTSEACKELAFLKLSPESLAAFKTPTLRNVAATAPYGHDGRLPTIRDVLKHYNELGGAPVIGHRDTRLKRLGLGDRDLQALEKFLISLSSSIRDLATEQ